MPASVPRSRLIIVSIMLCLLAWGVLLAVGAYRYNLDLRKPLIVLACVAAFVGIWVVLLVGAIVGKLEIRKHFGHPVAHTTTRLIGLFDFDPCQFAVC